MRHVNVYGKEGNGTDEEKSKQTRWMIFENQLSGPMQIIINHLSSALSGLMVVWTKHVLLTNLCWTEHEEESVVQ